MHGRCYDEIKMSGKYKPKWKVYTDVYIREACYGCSKALFCLILELDFFLSWGLT